MAHFREEFEDLRKRNFCLLQHALNLEKVVFSVVTLGASSSASVLLQFFGVGELAPTGYSFVEERVRPASGKAPPLPDSVHATGTEEQQRVVESRPALVCAVSSQRGSFVHLFVAGAHRRVLRVRARDVAQNPPLRLHIPVEDCEGVGLHGVRVRLAAVAAQPGRAADLLRIALGRGGRAVGSVQRLRSSAAAHQADAVGGRTAAGIHVDVKHPNRSRQSQSPQNGARSRQGFPPAARVGRAAGLGSRCLRHFRTTNVFVGLSLRRAPRTGTALPRPLRALHPKGERAFKHHLQKPGVLSAGKAALPRGVQRCDRRTRTRLHGGHLPAFPPQPQNHCRAAEVLQHKSP